MSVMSAWRHPLSAVAIAVLATVLALVLALPRSPELAAMLIAIAWSNGLYQTARRVHLESRHVR